MGVGDMLADKRQVVGKYYLVQGDTEEYSLVYNVGDVFVSREPSSHTLIAYAFDDAFLVAKSRSFEGGQIVYTVIDRAQDDGYAEDRKVYIDTIPEVEYKGSWLDKRNFRFVEVNQQIPRDGG